MSTSIKRYIGDSVYVEFDGFDFILTTENGTDAPASNTIALEPDVYEALVAFVDSVRQELVTQGSTPPPKES